MNIILLTSVPGNGGSSATLFHNAKLLNAQGCNAVFFSSGTYWKERGRTEGVPTNESLELRRGFRPISFLRDFLRLRGHILSEDVNAVIVQKSPEQWLAGLVLKFVKKPVALVRLRGVVFPIKASAFNRWLHNRMDAVICSASVIAQQYRSLRGFNTDNVQTLLEGIDPKKFAPAMPEQRAAARAKWKLDPNAIVIGTAGRPSPVKGHEVLVRAFAKAFADNEQKTVRLAIFSDESRRGPGSYKSLDKLCTELRIRSRVDLIPGFVEDMREVYHALDAYVLPSLGSEGSSRAGLEACACGLPLIASRVGVLPDLILENKTGWLIPPGDVDALALKLNEVVTCRSATRQLGADARARIVEQFDEAHYGEMLRDVLEDAVRKRERS